MTQNSGKWIQLHIGFDDTDSLKGGCTTYLAARLIHDFLSSKPFQDAVTFLDFPNLIRLNPNIPYRTRGNGAVVLRLMCQSNIIDSLFEHSCEVLHRYAETSESQTQPGLVMWIGTVNKKILEFGTSAIQKVLDLKKYHVIADQFLRDIKTYSENGGRGLIGALAAIGNPLTKTDYTFEFIAYRDPSFWGKTRRIQKETVFLINQNTMPETFSNIDPTTQQVLITPKGADPVLYGIRGNTAEIVLKAHQTVESLEPIPYWVIYRTNQGTNQHYDHTVSVNDLSSHISVCIQGIITGLPYTIQGGHVFTQFSDGTGEIILAAYEPTHEFRKTIKKLIPGDRLRVMGSIRPKHRNYGLTMNLEGIEIIELTPLYTEHAPICPQCEKRLTSDGRDNGYKCKRCHKKYPLKTKTLFLQNRNLDPVRYLVPPCAYRHLTKPLSRYGQEKSSWTRTLPIKTSEFFYAHPSDRQNR